MRLTLIHGIAVGIRGNQWRPKGCQASGLQIITNCQKPRCFLHLAPDSPSSSSSSTSKCIDAAIVPQCHLIFKVIQVLLHYKMSKIK
jgi:hypothetical protein